MFYPAVMNKVLVGVHHSGFQRFITGLHEAGFMEISDIKDSIHTSNLQIHKHPDPEEINRVIGAQLFIDQLVEVGQKFIHTDNSVISTWFSPPKDERVPGYTGDITSVCKQAEVMAGEATSLLTTFKELNKIQDALKGISTSRDILKYLLAGDLNPEHLISTRYTETVAGVVLIDDVKEVEERIRSEISDELYINNVKCGDEMVMVLVTTARNREAFLDALRTHLFRRITPTVDLQGKPSELLIILEKNQILLSEKTKKLEIELAGLAKIQMPGLMAIREELSFIRERIEAGRKFGGTEDVVFIEGWIQETDLNRLKTTISQTVGEDAFFIAREPDESDKVPVHYNNPTWLRPFEFLTTMYAPPRYGEIDPTPFFAPVFILFFGLMLGDAGYGLIIVLVSWLLYRGIGQRDESSRNMCIVLMACGVVDVICGIFQGGWFGDILPRFFGITAPFVLIEPLKSPIQFFQLSLIIGIIHINLGIFLGFWQSYKKRLYREAFQDHLIWYIIQPCAAILLTQFFGWASVPGLIILTSEIIIIGSFGVLFLSKGPMFFFSLTGFLGDWLSYVRILALALATGGIAMTINLLAEMISSAHPFLLIPAIIFLIAGQTFNLVIQVLGSVIHALRLHYIEFFGKFYTGGGRLFLPFKTQREHTLIHQNGVID